MLYNSFISNKLTILLNILFKAVPQDDSFVFKTERKVPRTGIMLVGHKHTL